MYAGQGLIQDFPLVGEGALFDENVYKNDRFGSRWGCTQETSVCRSATGALYKCVQHEVSMTIYVGSIPLEENGEMCTDTNADANGANTDDAQKPNEPKSCRTFRHTPKTIFLNHLAL